MWQDQWKETCVRHMLVKALERSLINVHTCTHEYGLSCKEEMACSVSNKQATLST